MTLVGRALPHNGTTTNGTKPTTPSSLPSTDYSNLLPLPNLQNENGYMMILPSMYVGGLVVGSIPLLFCPFVVPAEEEAEEETLNPTNSQLLCGLSVSGKVSDCWTMFKSQVAGTPYSCICWGTNAAWLVVGCWLKKLSFAVFWRACNVFSLCDRCSRPVFPT